MEALKAQAVTARTYALHHSRISRDSVAGKDYDVTSTVHSQVYEGAHKEGFRAREACKQTQGLALLRHGAIFPSYYHSCCGGITEHAHNVWSGASGPPQIKDRFCSRSSKLSWKLRVSARELAEKLSAAGYAVGRITGVHAAVEDDSPRNRAIVLAEESGTQEVPATELRRLLGYSELKSTWFDVTMKGDEIVFTGRGYGHGVGMCQWGAKGMADEGHTYREILKHYYPDAEIARMY
jgi:stage II sporulation protein D